MFWTCRGGFERTVPLYPHRGCYKNDGGGGKSGRTGGGGGEPEPENWYDSPKYQKASDQLYQNLLTGKISNSDANSVLDAKNKAFSEGLKTKNRSPEAQQKLEKLSNEIQATQHALNLFERGAPNAKFRRF